MLTDQEDQHPTPPTESPAVPTPVGVLDYEAQRDWENFQVTRGIWRYQRSLQRELKDGKRVNRAISELEPGHRRQQRRGERLLPGKRKWFRCPSMCGLRRVGLPRRGTWDRDARSAVQ